MKKAIAIILCLTLVGMLFACGEEPQKQDSVADAYLKAAQEFVNQGDLESAMAALEEGMKVSADSRLGAYLEQIKAMQSTTAPTVDGTTTVSTTVPTTAATTAPTTVPTTAPTTVPTTAPTTVPTTVPTTAPTVAPVKDYNYYLATWATEDLSRENGGLILIICIDYGTVAFDLAAFPQNYNGDFNRLIGSVSPREFKKDTHVLDVSNMMGTTVATMTVNFEEDAVSVTITDLLTTEPNDPLIGYDCMTVKLVKNPYAFDEMPV